ncbi:olfactory receptor 52W1 [Pipistrellus kuhlii]|uniref:Olfactory receptor family 52 subfamily W member 1 n=1 Tax=Pipistrellus kuhlii TaxID=59472 RepID=A0A7J7X158_PIPKU|nr:olfactory receptor 52W1 [Pipistrellus kuhlii]KAF6343344.1 olfactory receptor family 52 subfamily W member 1 [Pipistrellus kuhlii]
MVEVPLPNATFPRPAFFLLTGIPGLRGTQAWLTLVFGPMHLLALLGNGTMLAVVQVDSTLCQPMFLLLVTLAATDLGLDTSVGSGLLAVMWSGTRPVPYAACLVQMFFVHALTAMESGVLLAMACDGAMAVGSPLHYSILVTKARVGYAALALALKAMAIVVPFPLLVARFEHFRAKTIEHAYCAHMAGVELVVGNTRANNLYGLALSLAVSGVDILGITGCYGLTAHTVLRLPTKEARAKCSSHVCVILAFYVPGLFSYLTHHFGHHTVSKPVHILLSNIYLLLPPALNPLIYGARTKQIRDRLLETFTFRKSQF